MKDKCVRCGRCCLLKVAYGSVSIALPKHCPNFYLDNGLGTCRIYEKRIGTFLGIDNVCLSIEEVMVQRLLPNDCPYVKNHPGYRSRVLNYAPKLQKGGKDESRKKGSQDELWRG